MPFVQFTAAYATIDGNLYMAASSDSPDTAPFQITTLTSLNLSTGVWYSDAPMPTARTNPTAGVINDLLYVAGGAIDNNNGTYASNLEVYNPTTNSWAELSPMPTARAGAAAGVVNGILYVVGGINNIGMY